MSDNWISLARTVRCLPVAKLDDIGFYTLSEERCRTASKCSPLVRGEIVLSDACNFRCPYCRGQRSDLKQTLTLEKAKSHVSLLAANGLRNLRLSGGEPTLWRGLEELVWHARSLGILRIAVSTNGSASSDLYRQLVVAGCNDFSVSLDACCAATGAKMSGKPGAWKRVVQNIRLLASLTYTTVGVVVAEDTIGELENVVALADELGVSDIRVIPAAQWQPSARFLERVSALAKKYPILGYRVRNAELGNSVRGIGETDSNRCGIALDDVAIAGDWHFPCIIYLREQGNPIGLVSGSMREERSVWSETHDTKTDPICKANCLDCIVQYNRQFAQYRSTEGGAP